MTTLSNDAAPPISDQAGIVLVGEFKERAWMSEKIQDLSPEDRVREWLDTVRGFGLQKKTRSIPTTIADYWAVQQREMSAWKACELVKFAWWESGGGITSDRVAEIVAEVIPEVFAEYWIDLFDKESEKAAS
jgi:hypothetical protein